MVVAAVAVALAGIALWLWLAPMSPGALHCGSLANPGGAWNPLGGTCEGARERAIWQLIVTFVTLVAAVALGAVLLYRAAASRGTPYRQDEMSWPAH